MEGGRGHASRRDGIPSGIKQPLYNDIYSYNLENNSVQLLATTGEPPSKRKAHTCVLYNDSMQ